MVDDDFDYDYDDDDDDDYGHVGSSGYEKSCSAMLANLGSAVTHLKEQSAEEVALPHSTRCMRIGRRLC